MLIEKDWEGIWLVQYGRYDILRGTGVMGRLVLWGWLDRKQYMLARNLAFSLRQYAYGYHKVPKSINHKS